MIQHIRTKEYLLLSILYFTTILLVYFGSNIIAHAFLFILLFSFYKSKNNYFWFGLFFMLFDSPGYLLHPFDLSHNLGLLGLPLGGERDLYFTEIFIFVAYFKAVQNKKSTSKSAFRTAYIGLFFVIYYLFLISFLYDFPFNRFLRALRGVLPFTLLYAIPKLLPRVEDYKRLFLLIAPFVVFVVIIQIGELFSGVRTAQLLGGTIGFLDESLRDGSIDVLRPLYSYIIIEVIFIGVLFLLAINTSLKKWYLYSILALCIISLVLSATRGITLALIIMLILYEFIIQKNIFRTFKYLIFASFAVFILALLLNFNPTISTQFYGSFERLLTLESLAKGDITAGGTLGRLSVRAPRILSKIEQNSVLGFGFSEDFWQYHDGHLGHHNMILNSGIVGYSLFLLFVFYFYFKIFKIYNQVSSSNPLKKGLLVPLVGLTGMLVHHSTTYTIFAYISHIPLIPVWMLVTLFFSFTDVLLRESV